MPATTRPTTTGPVSATRRSRHRAAGAALAVALALVVGAAACGSDDDTTAEGAPALGDATTTTTDGVGTGSGDDPTSGAEGADGSITFASLEERCDDLTDLAAELRGEEPAAQRSGSIPPGPTEASVDGVVGYETASCLYRFGEDAGAGAVGGDDDEVAFVVERLLPEGADSRAVLDVVWDALSVTEPVGDGPWLEAKFHATTSIEARSVLHVRVDDDTFVRVRVKAPADLEGSPFLEADVLSATAADLLERLDLDDGAG